MMMMMMTSCKRETLNTIILKHETTSIDIRLDHFSHETIGAQFPIGRTRGEGGQVAFLRTSPK